MGGRTRHKLTATAIKAAKPGRLQDGAGLMLERSETGGSWVYRYSLHGRRREMGLGSWPDLSLAEARKARDRWAAELAQGRDPIAAREHEREVERAARDREDPTLEEAVALVFEGIKATLREDGERGRWMSPLRKHVLPKLGERRLSGLHQRDLKEVLAPIWQTKPTTAGKTIRRLAIVFRQGKLMGWPCDPFTVESTRHMLGAVRHVEEPIEATPWPDVPALYAKLSRLGPSHLALRMMILTLVRSKGVREMRFSEVTGDVWTVPAARMKGREGKVEDFRVPLSPAALDVLRAARETAEGDLVFVGLRGGAVTDTALQKALNVLKEVGRPHGFRTSFRTWTQDTEACTRDVAEMVLAHRVYGEVEGRYARSDLLEQRREVMAKWAEFVTGAPTSPP